MTTYALTPWGKSEAVSFPATAQPSEIISHAVQLSAWNRRSLLIAFEGDAYELAATFVWSKAMAVLKRRLSALGMEFVGEMLGRIDLEEASNPISDIREDEAIELAEQLGMIRTPEAIQLRNSQVLLNHFRDPDLPHEDTMDLEGAISVLRSCIASLLGNPEEKISKPFAQLCESLETTILKAHSPAVQQLAAAPYFFIRTTLTVLLTHLKVATGAQLEIAAANTLILLPGIWPKLRDRDRWQTGETYAIVQASGRVVAASGMRAALMQVDGFDFVPETLRSETFRAAARAVLSAHSGWDNFDNEQKPMELLERLGSSVPGPALADCLTAALCIRLGNRYGHSLAAQPAADSFLKLFRPKQWQYYLNKALTGDRHVLEKLAYDDLPLTRWQDLIADYSLNDLKLDSRIAKLVTSDHRKQLQIKKTATGFRERIMQEA